VRYWNQSRNAFHNGEPEKHRSARYVVRAILKRQGYHVNFGDQEAGYKLPLIHPPLDRPQKQPYTVDIFAVDTHGNTRYIEIDGDIHRSSQTRIDKTNKKHAQIKECLKIVLIHLEPDDCVGKYALSDVDIWYEIEKQYSRGQRQLIFETFKYDR
jgi:hypothetical protein